MTPNVTTPITNADPIVWLLLLFLLLGVLTGWATNQLWPRVVRWWRENRP